MAAITASLATWQSKMANGCYLKNNTATSPKLFVQKVLLIILTNKTAKIIKTKQN